VLSDVALRSIADNLAALRLDPVPHLKIAVAIVGPLMGVEATVPASLPKKAGTSKNSAAANKPAKRKAKPGTAVEGENNLLLNCVGRASGDQIRAQSVRDHSHWTHHDDPAAVIAF
jgi:hypothetical protein